MRARAALLLLALTPLLAVVSPSLPFPHPLPVAKGDAEVVRTADGDTIYVQLRDRYGRLLAYVWTRRSDGGEVMVNAELVRLGYAAVMTVPPNVRHAALFRRLAAEAREEHRGLWAEPLTEPRGIQ